MVKRRSVRVQRAARRGRRLDGKSGMITGSDAEITYPQSQQTYIKSNIDDSEVSSSSSSTTIEYGALRARPVSSIW